MIYTRDILSSANDTLLSWNITFFHVKQLKLCLKDAKYANTTTACGIDTHIGDICTMYEQLDSVTPSSSNEIQESAGNQLPWATTFYTRPRGPARSIIYL